MIAIFHLKGAILRTIGAFHESENYYLLEDRISNLSKMDENQLNEKYFNKERHGNDEMGNLHINPNICHAFEASKFSYDHTLVKISDQRK